MPYKIFISHSTRDQGLVISLANLLSNYGIEVTVAEWYLAPGKQLDKKVFGQIANSDCVVVLLTQNGIRSNWVQQEIGYALSAGFGKNKPLIPLVEKGIELKDLGALQGKEYIEYDTYRPEKALMQTSTFLKSLKLRKEEQEKALFSAAGIIGFLLLLSLSGGRK